MKIESHRFGTIEIGAEDIIRFPQGLIGFPGETEFVLVPHGNSTVVAWLHAAKNPAFALPVVSAHGLIEGYAGVALGHIAKETGLRERAEDLAVMAVLSAPTGKPATVNLLAPIVVDTMTRTGRQVVLDGTRFTTGEQFLLTNKEPQAAVAQTG
jgi:flagellar assembly factor FliW